MTRYSKYFSGFCIIVFISFSGFAQDSKTLLNQMFASVKSMKTVQFSFDSKERVNGKIIHEVSDFKINVLPFKAYMYQQIPVKGLEVLYVSNGNEGKAKVNPNAFPWVTLNLDPEGSLMLDKHHHSILEGGYVYTTSLIEFLFKKYEADIEKLITNNGIVKVQGRDCYYLTFTNSKYKMVRYTVGSKETPLTLAKKLNLNYFTILENNPNISGIGEVKPGTNLVLPNDYASKMELYIDKSKLIPVYIKIYDQKGLFEEYSFFNVIVNPIFKSDVFSADNSGYNF